MVEETLTRKGLRATPHRVCIAEQVLKNHCHFTADELFDWASNRKQKISRASVYNILNEFVAVGLLKSFYSSVAGKTIYDSNLNQHFHFYDIDSKEIVDIDPSTLNIDTKSLEGYQVETMEVLLSGRKRV